MLIIVPKMQIYVILRSPTNEDVDAAEVIVGATISRETLRQFIDVLKEKEGAPPLWEQPIPDNPRYFYTIPLIQFQEHTYSMITLDSEAMP